MGVPNIARTDCHDAPGSFVGVNHGESFHPEPELVVEAGLSAVNACPELPFSLQNILGCRIVASLRLANGQISFF